MCGLTDVRQRKSGEYYCTICARELGKDFDVVVRRWSGEQYHQQLRAQCDPDGKAKCKGSEVSGAMLCGKQLGRQKARRSRTIRPLRPLSE